MTDKDPAKVARQREQARERQRRRRERQRAEEAAEGAEVSPLRAEAGEGVLEAVRAELERLPAARLRPGTAAALLRLAEVLADPTAAPQAPSAARALMEGLAELRSAGASSGGKLAELRAVRDRGSA